MKITEHRLEEMFDDFLDEIYPDLKIACYTYQTSSALKEVDPTAYRQEYLNWLDSQLEDGNLFEDGYGYNTEDPEHETED